MYAGSRAISMSVCGGRRGMNEPLVITGPYGVIEAPVERAVSIGSNRLHPCPEVHASETETGERECRLMQVRESVVSCNGRPHSL